MTRIAGWSQALAAKVEEWRARPFEYGTADCWQFAAEAVLALTGVDYRDRFAVYGSQQEADAILTARGGMVGIANECLGKPKPVCRAMRGDLLLIDLAQGPTAAICLGLMCCAPGQDGLTFERAAKARLAWTV